MKLIGIIFGSLVAVFLSLGIIHFWGLGQRFLPYDNKFFESPKPWVIVPWEQAFFTEKDPNLVLLVRVFINESGQLLVSSNGEKIDLHALRQITASPTHPLLSELISKYRQQRFVIEVLSNVADIQLKLAEVLQPFAAAERFLIQSEYNNVLSATKELLPRLAYGSTPSDTMRFKSFLGLEILTAAPFKGDVYFTSLKINHRAAINERISEELQRRHKPIIVGPIYNIEEAKLVQSLGVAGIYVEKPEWLLQWLSEKK
jgi:hypothetical protein